MLTSSDTKNFTEEFGTQKNRKVMVNHENETEQQKYMKGCRKAPQPDTKPSQLWFALRFGRCLEPLKQKARKPSLMGSLRGEPSTVVGRDHMLTQAHDRSVRPKNVWVVGHPFFNGAGDGSPESGGRCLP